MIKGIDGIAFAYSVIQWPAMSFAISPFQVERDFTCIYNAVTKPVPELFTNIKGLVFYNWENFFRRATQKE
jgi:hypothetical protein